MVELKYLLDTNICIYLMKQQPERVIQRFAQCKIGEIALSAITWAELCCGMDVRNGKIDMMALFGKLVPREFDMSAAATFGQLSQQFPNRKNSFDRMIAAHAISLHVALVTNNTVDFELYIQAGLKLENWVSD
jgi:tRNA(fMet)-specific endonuclease VapC